MTSAIVLYVIGGGFIILAHYYFISNTQDEYYDQMGASISFDQPFGLGALLICLGLFFHDMFSWVVCLGLFFLIELLSLVYKWFILAPLLSAIRKK